MMNSPNLLCMKKLLVTACAIALAGALAGCSTGLTPPFPDVAPLSKAVLSSEQQQKAIKDLAAAKSEQEAAAGQATKAVH